MQRLTILIFAFCMTLGPAFADVTEKTTYKPFLVRGKSASAIYKSVIDNSYKKNELRTFATTNVTLTPKIKLATKPQCKITQASITARFIVNLPHLENEAALAPDLRQDWEDFSAVLKHHEERHRNLWLGCAAKLTKAATGVRASDCNSFATRFDARIRAVNELCQAQDDAFDDAEHKRLPGIPFIQRAMKDQ